MASVRICLEQIVANLLKHQAHQIHALKAAVA